MILPLFTMIWIITHYTTHVLLAALLRKDAAAAATGPFIKPADFLLTADLLQQHRGRDLLRGDSGTSKSVSVSAERDDMSLKKTDVRNVSHKVMWRTPVTSS